MVLHRRPSSRLHRHISICPQRQGLGACGTTIGTANGSIPLLPKRWQPRQRPLSRTIRNASSLVISFAPPNPPHLLTQDRDSPTSLVQSTKRPSWLKMYTGGPDGHDNKDECHLPTNFKYALPPYSNVHRLLTSGPFSRNSASEVDPAGGFTRSMRLFSPYMSAPIAQPTTTVAIMTFCAAIMRPSYSCNSPRSFADIGFNPTCHQPDLSPGKTRLSATQPCQLL